MAQDEPDLQKLSKSELSSGMLTKEDRKQDQDDVVTANNQLNDHLNGMPAAEDVEGDKKTAVAGEETVEDEIDDDWFLKLTNSKDCPRVPPVDGASDFGSQCARIPLLCEEDADFKEKTMRTLRDGLKKIWKRGSATITVEDPTYKVAYLGNVLTGWAKGEGCIEKPLNSLWKNYNGSSKPDVQMKITVTQSGLKAVTKDHGLIEYWSHRITYCTVPPSLPRVFCWIYRHEGRKLKQELRCHAILCSKESMAARMATTLRLRLAQALLEFKRDKLLRQNARLSLANSVYDNPSLPRRKILLSTGSHNYKPPLERSKSAPKLMSIEESLEEEESTPKVKRKFNGVNEDEEEEVDEVDGKEPTPVRDSDNRLTRSNGEDTKCEYKLTNLNFVKKLCSSIENLVESTSNYGKKLLNERKSSNKDFCLAMGKELGSKKIGVSVGGGQQNGVGGGEEALTRFRHKKNVMFDVSRHSDCSEPVTCTDFKRLEEEELLRPPMEITLEVRDQESDEGSNSLQSISSCCSDGSSLVTSSSDGSRTYKPEVDLFLDGKDSLVGCETSMDRLHNYLSTCKDAFMDEVVLHPTGRGESAGIIEEDDVEEANDDDDTFGRTSDYVDLTENLVKRLSLDKKEKDVPYHKIIKSTALSQTRLQSSCLQI